MTTYLLTSHIVFETQKKNGRRKRTTHMFKWPPGLPGSQWPQDLARPTNIASLGLPESVPLLLIFQ